MSTVNVKASIKAVRISPRKMSVVASLVRGRNLEDAITILEHTPRRAAKPLAKLLQSAGANAQNNHNAKVDTLKIEKLEVNHSMRAKRYRPAAHGRALPYQLRHSSVKVELSGEERPKKAPKTEKADKPEAKDTKSESKKETK